MLKEPETISDPKFYPERTRMKILNRKLLIVEKTGLPVNASAITEIFCGEIHE
jgi:phosphomevalonate kinase